MSRWWMPGTVELVRAQGVEVTSSAELIQEFEACLNDAQFESHLEAGRRVDKVRGEAFRFIGEKLSHGASEVMVRDWIRDQFSAAGLITDSGPIVGVNAHAGDPHYDPTPETSSPIRPGDFVLLDMWAKLDQPDSVYYDITWTGFCGDAPPRVREVFEMVREARDQAIDTVSQSSAREPSDPRIRSGRCSAQSSFASAGLATGLSIAPATRSEAKFTAPAPTWTTWKRTTNAASFPAPFFDRAGNLSGRLRRAARKWTFSSPRIRRRRPGLFSGTWSGSDNLGRANENPVEHRLRQFSGGSVLLARMI